MFIVLAAAKTAAETGTEDWLSTHATLLVGLVGIVVSGFLGPTVTSWWTARRDRSKDRRALIVARRDDLRQLIDEAAAALGGAVGNLRPLLEAEQKGQSQPKEPADFLGTLTPLGQRLRLRLPAEHPVIAAYGEVRGKLLALSKATGSQSQFDGAVENFEAEREVFLEAGRVAIQAPIVEDEKL